MPKLAYSAAPADRSKIVCPSAANISMKTATEEERMRNGTNFIALLWSEIASKVIEKAVHIYQLSTEHAVALRAAFRRYHIQVV